MNNDEEKESAPGPVGRVKDLRRMKANERGLWCQCQTEGCEQLDLAAPRGMNTARLCLWLAGALTRL